MCVCVCVCMCVCVRACDILGLDSNIIITLPFNVEIFIDKYMYMSAHINNIFHLTDYRSIVDPSHVNIL